jgi:hypothetical protein
MLLLLAFLYLANAQFDYPDQCAIAFRLDDIQEHFLVPTQIDIINTFVRNGVPLTIGIIPNFFGTDFDPSSVLTPYIRTLLSNGTALEAAAMTPNHEIISGLPLDQQIAALVLARASINQDLPNNPRPVTTFIAPFNLFDANTLRAIRLTNYSTFSAAITASVPEGGRTYYNRFENSCSAQNVGFVDGINHFPWQSTLSSPANTPIAVDFAIIQLRDAISRCPLAVIELNFISFQVNGRTDPARLNDLQIMINEARASGCELRLLQDMGRPFITSGPTAPTISPAPTTASPAPTTASPAPTTAGCPLFTTTTIGSNTYEVSSTAVLYQQAVNLCRFCFNSSLADVTLNIATVGSPNNQRFWIGSYEGVFTCNLAFEGPSVNVIPNQLVRFMCQRSLPFVQQTCFAT